MMKYQAILNTAEIALAEHELIESMQPLEDCSEDMVFYLAGVHDMADKIIKVIKNTFPNDEGSDNASEYQF